MEVETVVRIETQDRFILMSLQSFARLVAALSQRLTCPDKVAVRQSYPSERPL